MESKAGSHFARELHEWDGFDVTQFTSQPEFPQLPSKAQQPLDAAGKIRPTCSGWAFSYPDLPKINSNESKHSQEKAFQNEGQAQIKSRWR
jgi:hypothetical protein